MRAHKKYTQHEVFKYLLVCLYSICNILYLLVAVFHSIDKNVYEYMYAICTSFVLVTLDHNNTFQVVIVGVTSVSVILFFYVHVKTNRISRQIAHVM